MQKNRLEYFARNIARPDFEALEEYSEGRLPLLISMGNTAILSVGGKAVQNRFFRYLKDIVRIRYFFQLKKQRLKLNIGI